MIRKYSELIVLAIILVVVSLFMWAVNGTNFMLVGNFQSMAFQLPELGILTLAMVFAMLTSGINLSIIASANLSGIVMAIILTRTVPSDATGIGIVGIVILAIVAGLATSGLIGLLNGFLIAVLDISPILATLGTMIMGGGLALVLTNGSVISGLPPAMLWIGNGFILGIPVPILIFTACALIMALILRRTPLGTRIHLIGSNPTACFFSGVNNRTVLIRTYIISGIYAGVAAMIMISRFNSAKADYGESYLLLTILAAVLGGVNPAGGFGRVAGVTLSVMILQIISSGLNLIGVSNFLTLSLWGGILIFVMVIKFVIEYFQERVRTV
jgi:simple sugar transport system permease protein